MNQRVAVDHELAQILNRPPVPSNTGRVVVNGTSHMTIPIGQGTPRVVENLQMGQQTFRDNELTGKITESRESFSTLRSRNTVIKCYQL